MKYSFYQPVAKNKKSRAKSEQGFKRKGEKQICVKKSKSHVLTKIICLYFKFYFYASSVPISLNIYFRYIEFVKN